MLRVSHDRGTPLGIKAEGEGEIAVFTAKRWDRRSSEVLIELATPCHDTQVVGPYQVSNPLCLTVLTAKSVEYTTALQYLQRQLV